MKRLILSSFALWLLPVMRAEEVAPPPPAEILTDDPSLLPKLGEIPDAAALEAEWEMADRPVVDPLSLARIPYVLPPAASLLPPRAIVPPARCYHTLTFRGNRAISRARLAKVAPWATRQEIGLEDREALADLFTRHYLSLGYINSGATVPEPPPGSGELVVEITEGRLTEVKLDRGPRDDDFPLPEDACLTCIFNGQRNLRASFLVSRVRGNPSKPLNFIELQQRLQILQMNPNIKRLQAQLRPCLLPGEARVDLLVEENPPWSFGADFHNQLPPSVGAEQLDLWVENRNLTGFGDFFGLRYGVFGGGIDDTRSAGTDNLDFRYALPVLRDDTTLELFYDRQGYAIIEQPFTDLDITGSTWNAGVGVRRPILRNVQDDLWWGISMARKHSETELLGEPFSVSPGYVDGELDLTLLRVGIDWVRRSERQVITNHTEIVAGLNSLGATDPGEVPDGEPDSSFLALRTNGSYLARLNAAGHLLFLRAGAQWADDPLPSPEQWTLGGMGSVRGYRQNELVRDAGATGSVEYRVPVISEKSGELNLVAFFDSGVAMDHDGENSESLFSVGIGITGNYRGWLRGEIYLGIPLTERPNEGDNLQDYGINFRLTAGRF